MSADSFALPSLPPSRSLALSPPSLCICLRERCSCSEAAPATWRGVIPRAPTCRTYGCSKQAQIYRIPGSGHACDMWLYGCVMDYERALPLTCFLSLSLALSPLPPSLSSTPGSCLDHACIMPGSCLHHAWIMPGSCLHHAWIMPASFLDHAWIIPRSCLDHACIMPGSCLDQPEHQWSHPPLPGRQPHGLRLKEPAPHHLRGLGLTLALRHLELQCR